MNKKFCMKSWTKPGLVLSLPCLMILAALPGGRPAYATNPGVPATYTLDADFDQGTLINVNHNAPNNNQLQLDSRATPFNFVWVAVSSKGTVVKIDANTGEVLGEYRTAPQGMGLDPSRTTVDSKGNVWVTNRAESGFVNANAIALGVPPVDRFMGSVTYIGLKENGQCQDRNNNGIIDTSTGLGDILVWSNGGGADRLGGVSTAEDECIIHYTRVNSTGARHVSVDANNNVWVSGIGGRYFDLIDSTTGSIIRQEPSVGYGGYGGLIDGNGVIWSARSLLRWDTVLPLTGPNGDPPGPSIGPPTSGTNWSGQTDGSYGLCINPNNGEVWNTQLSGDLIRRYAPNGTHLGDYRHGFFYAQGCVVDSNGHVWVAHSLLGGGNSVGHLDANGTWLGNVVVGNGPTGVAVDGNGKVWATNYYDGTVSRIDPAGNSGIGAVDLITGYLGGNLYNYSDMTGSTLIAPPDRGSWTVVHDTQQDPAKIKISWTGATPGDSSLTVNRACSSDNVNFGPEQPVINGVAASVSACQYVKVIVAFQRSTTDGDDIDDAKDSPVLYDLTISTNEPPVCSAAYPSPKLIWPPNHKFVPVQILGVTDPDGDPIMVTPTSVFQDEPVQGPSSGNTSPDAALNPLAVRAERNGDPKTPGNGRVYHLSFTADDGQGGSCAGTVKVCVPHDQGRGNACVDGGPLFNSLAP